MPYICGDMVGDWPRGFPCFLLAKDTEGNAAIGSPLLFVHSQRVCYYVCAAEKVSSTHWAFLKESPIHV